MLRLPVSQELAGARRILLAGCGGGYDVLGALPLVAELRAEGREVHLASLSFSSLGALAVSTELANLYEVTGTRASEDFYCPEAWLARWLDRPIWCFSKTGVQPLRAAYRWLASRLGLDAIILIDGGVDSILRGDESSIGTPSEDLTSLVAVQGLDVPTKILACVGLGAELLDGICHAQVFERIAELTRLGGYLGSVGLSRTTEAGRFYLEGLDFVLAHQTRQRGSHIHGVIRKALLGEFGSRGPHVWLSPLLTQLWFFRLEAVVGSHLFAHNLEKTHDIFEVTVLVEALRENLRVKDRDVMPI